MHNDLVLRARLYATEMHERITQRRKYTHAPYDVHLKAVADLVASVSSDPEMIAAAWLHDTVEDTQATFEDIEREFGMGVMSLVMELTDVSVPFDGNRAVRKELDRNHLAAASTRAKTIKLADIIDNTLDITRHDPRFSRTYIPEMLRLLEVLSEGNQTLYLKASDLVSRSAVKLGIPVQHGANPAEAHTDPVSNDSISQQFRGLRLFTESFTARNLFEPLRSFDFGTPLEKLEKAFEESGIQVLGIREEGRLIGYLQQEDLAAGLPRRFAASQIVQLETSLMDIIHSLSFFSHCFVSLEGEVIGVISRGDIEKPAARMWLFGLIMLIDLSATRTIAETWPDGGWLSVLTPARRAKAEELHSERVRQKKPGSLLECVQFSDKLHILSSGERFVETSGFASASAAKRVFKGLESLRNNLAHGQEIANVDWPSVVRLSRFLGAMSLEK